MPATAPALASLVTFAREPIVGDSASTTRCADRARVWPTARRLGHIGIDTVGVDINYAQPT